MDVNTSYTAAASSYQLTAGGSRPGALRSSGCSSLVAGGWKLEAGELAAELVSLGISNLMCSLYV